MLCKDCNGVWSGPWYEEIKEYILKQQASDKPSEIPYNDSELIDKAEHAYQSSCSIARTGRLAMENAFVQIRPYLRTTENP